MTNKINEENPFIHNSIRQMNTSQVKLHSRENNIQYYYQMTRKCIKSSDNRKQKLKKIQCQPWYANHPHLNQCKQCKRVRTNKHGSLLHTITRTRVFFWGGGSIHELIVLRKTHPKTSFFLFWVNITKKKCSFLRNLLFDQALGRI